jgi:hypothetical protein
MPAMRSNNMRDEGLGFHRGVAEHHDILDYSFQFVTYLTFTYNSLHAARINTLEQVQTRSRKFRFAEHVTVTVVRRTTHLRISIIFDEKCCGHEQSTTPYTMNKKQQFPSRYIFQDEVVWNPRAQTV